MMQPRYNALRGDELKKVLFTKFEQMLGDNPAFSAAIAHHSPQYAMTLEISSYPYEKKDEFEIQGGEDHGEPPEGVPNIAGQFDDEGVVEFPDKEREASGLPVPDSAVGPDGQMSDYSAETEMFQREVPEPKQ